MSTASPSNNVPVNQLVFILSDVAGWQTLLGSMPSGAEVHMLDASGDALDQMASILAGRSGLDAIHLVSHGSPGSLSLGTTSLTATNLTSHASQLSVIGSAFSANGDFLLYGCDVAAGSVGSAFINQLAQATGADVAASTDLTGAASLGGDWQLESSIGAIETHSLELQGLETTLAAPSISNLTSSAFYTEGGSATHIDSSLSFSGGSGYGGGYVEYSLASSVAGDQLSLTAGNGITISGNSVYYNSTFIGSIDSTYNGVNGHALRINFTSNFTNPSFESGSTGVGVSVTGWTIINQQIWLGSDSLGGWVTPADGGQNSLNGSFNWSIASDGSSGGQSLRLYNNGTIDSYGIVHGPAAVSNTFEATAGDVLYFDWKAAGGTDAFDAFGYLLNTADGSYTVVLNRTGVDASETVDWNTKSVTVPTSGNYEFIFVSGSYDATGGTATGGSLYIDNFKVYSNSVNDVAAQALAQRVAYQNTADDAPSGARALTVTAADGSGATTSGTTQLTVTGVNDAPSLTGNATLTAVNEDCSAPTGATIAALFGALFRDPDTSYTPSDSLSGLIVVGDSSTAGEGKWQFSLDGSTWNDIGSVSTDAGLALSASTLLRFLPLHGNDVEPGSAGYAGTPGSLSVLAVDSTFASSGVIFTTDPASHQTYNTTTSGSTGGSSAVASASVLLDTSVTDWVIDGTAGNDVLTGTGSDDKIKAYAGNDTLTGGGGSDTMYGYQGDDVLVADDSDALIDGGSGTDTARFAAGVSAANLLDGDMINIENIEITNTGNAAYDFSSQTENLNITGGSGNDTITGGSGNDTIAGGSGIDSLNGGDGDDILLAEDTDALIDGGNHTTGDTARFAAGVSAANLLDGDMINIENIEITNTGNAAYDFSSQTENLNITGGGGNDTITGGSGNDTITGGSGNDTIAGGSGIDSLNGGNGDDILLAEDTDALIDGGSGIDTARFAAGVSAANLLDGDMINIENIEITNPGNAAYDFSSQTESLNITGGSGNDTITGGSGNDTITGGSGIDSLKGGNGDDILLAEDTDALIDGGNHTTGDTARFAAGVSAANLLDGDMINIENIEITNTGNAAYDFSSQTENLNITGGSGNDIIYGGKGDDNLVGGAGNDTLFGGAGNDTMKGGDGNDVFYLDSPRDSVEGGDGDDTVNYVLGDGMYVQSAFTFMLRSDIENLVLGGARKLNGIGNDADNRLTGNGQDNILDGKGGADTLIGGAGNDTYIVDNVNDVVSEVGGSGIDTVQSSVSYTLGSIEAAGVENLTLSGNASINATGNALANTLTGNSGNNILDGGAGADTLIGGAGNDTYHVDNAGDVILESSKGGTDLVLVEFAPAGNAYTLGAFLENARLVQAGAFKLTGNELDNELTGNSQNNTLIGGAGNDTLDGGAGSDNLDGGAGNDTYYVDNAGDTVTESTVTDGTDTVLSSVSFTLGNFVENLVLTGTADINAIGNSLANILTGNSGANVLTGNAGNDTLDGGAGADAMAGGAGNDTYYVDSAGDTVTESSAADGTDTVLSSVSFRLGNFVENLVLTGIGNIDATGNTQANILNGNAGHNRLDGGAGADVMAGGAGNDTYVVDNVGDKVTEYATAGTDLVEVAIAAAGGTYSLGDNVENGMLTNTVAFNLIGNTLSNTLTGNGLANLLDGGKGDDVMAGGDGNDIYVVDSANDVVTEAANQGTDLVRVAIATTGGTYTLGANIENGTLTNTVAFNLIGNAAANTLTGNAGANTLDGGNGSDTMYGGDGSDTYIVDSAGDVVNEVGGGGTDTVLASVTFTLNTPEAAGIEKLILTGIGNLNATGNALKNTLTGNSGNNLLDGGADADTMAGGAGDDIYVVDNTGDMIMEALGEGTDLVRVASATVKGLYTLHANVENATLTNAVDFNLTGNGLANVLTGNVQVNTIRGDAGNDTLIGGKGGDILIGGTGSDTFRFSAGDSGQASGFDQIMDYTKGMLGTGDLIDYGAALSIGGSDGAASSAQASINQTKGIASFAAGSGTTLSDALNDITARFTAAGNADGEFALFRVNNAGDYYLFVSDGISGVGANDMVVQLVGVNSIGNINLTAGDLTITS